jgi:anti-sigma regulatory factor (Ser/Thr protein kinase)
MMVANGGITTTPMATLTVPAQFASLTRGTAFVVAYATAAGFPPARVREIELAVEEVLSNICRYAYGDATGEVEIRCTQDATQHLLIEFIDTGRPFNILTLPPPDLTAAVDQRQVGGLGILLIRAMADTVTYCRDGNRNMLRLAVQLPQ